MPQPLSPIFIRDKIILPTLTKLEPFGDTCAPIVELLIGTAAAESKLGFYLRQLNGGPALGLWQMEPETEGDIWKNYLLFRTKLSIKVSALKTFTVEEMEWNHAYACAMARIKYMRDVVPLPAAGDIEAQAHYWKRVYNTDQGGGTVKHYLECWKELVEGKL